MISKKKIYQSGARMGWNSQLSKRTTIVCVASNKQFTLLQILYLTTDHILRFKLETMYGFVKVKVPQIEQGCFVIILTNSYNYWANVSKEKQSNKLLKRQDE